MKYIPVWTYDNYVSAHIAMGRLEEDGYNCWLKDENTVTIDPILTNAIGGIKLMVAETEAEKAWLLLKQLQKDHKALIPCPKCSSHNTESVSTPRKASNWFSAFIGMLFTNYAMPVETVNHCFDCGTEFPEVLQEEIGNEKE
jgi:DNA-directed RNA polymerase subunit RPC12/RpoP